MAVNVPMHVSDSRYDTFTSEKCWNECFSLLDDIGTEMEISKPTTKNGKSRCKMEGLYLEGALIDSNEFMPAPVSSSQEEPELIDESSTETSYDNFTFEQCLNECLPFPDFIGIKLETSQHNANNTVKNKKPRYDIENLSLEESVIHSDEFLPAPVSSSLDKPYLITESDCQKISSLLTWSEHDDYKTE